MAQIRMVKIITCSRKVCFLLFYGKVGTLKIDPKAQSWKERKEPLISLITMLGRSTLRSSKPKTNIMEKRCNEFLPPSFKLRWTNTWNKQWSKKDVVFIWAIWNKTIVVNVWKAMVDRLFNQLAFFLELIMSQSCINFWNVGMFQCT